MRAIHLEKGELSLREVPKPARAPGMALVRVLVAGICNTDLELQRGYYGFAGTPGHEFVGVVEEADTPALVGKRVVGEINLACERCDWCRKGLDRHCPNRTVLGIVNHPGAFADYLTLPERNLHALPGSLPSERAVFTEPLAAACEILEQAAIPSCAPVAVLGDGKLGLLIALTLQVYGYAVRLFGRHPEKLKIAERAGIVTVLGGEPLAAEFAWVVEATGKPQGLRAAIRMAKPRGTVILKSTVHGDVGLDTAAVVVNEITVVGSRCGRFEAALPLLERNLIPVEEMITARFSLASAAEAFAAATAPGALKVLLEPQA
jgi:threonine dehydrogenase-like Zn-dependent dehydrogenase